MDYFQVYQCVEEQLSCLDLNSLSVCLDKKMSSTKKHCTNTKLHMLNVFIRFTYLPIRLYKSLFKKKSNDWTNALKLKLECIVNKYFEFISLSRQKNKWITAKSLKRFQKKPHRDEWPVKTLFSKTIEKKKVGHEVWSTNNGEIRPNRKKMIERKKAP